MTTLSSIVSSIQDILQDAAYTDQNIIDKINDATLTIAGGIRMPNGQISPPLPDLFTQNTVTTSTTLPYVSLPVNYQRKVINIYDSSGYRIAPPSGGDYYAFALFLKRVSNFNLTEAGSVYRVCVKGSKLYYQGIPTAATTLGLIIQKDRRQWSRHGRAGRDSRAFAASTDQALRLQRDLRGSD